MKHAIVFKLFLTCLIIFSLPSCRKDVTPIQTSEELGDLNIIVSSTIDQTPFLLDSFLYTNSSQNLYSIARFRYYISAITLSKANGSTYNNHQIFFVDAASDITNLTLKGIPIGKYQIINFTIGIDSVQNMSNALPNTLENINMAWPDEIGGGYHFLKFEGRYFDDKKVERGFAIHIGTNGYQIHHQNINVPITIDPTNVSTIHLKMNINEWFKNPANFNFNTDGNYTMSFPYLMKKISENGKDVFTYEP